MQLGTIFPILSIPYLWLFTAEVALAQDRPAQISCARSIPQPVIIKSFWPNPKFVLTRENGTTGALETVKLRNGDKLAIVHGGCESYSLKFQFETSRFAADVTNTKYWFERAVRLMRQVERSIDTPMKISKGIQALDNYTKVSAVPSLDREIDYGSQDVRSTVRVAEIKKLGSKKFLVTVNFYYGPL
jgi:hypothetical protein